MAGGERLYSCAYRCSGIKSAGEGGSDSMARSNGNNAQTAYDRHKRSERRSVKRNGSGEKRSYGGEAASKNGVSALVMACGGEENQANGGGVRNDCKRM